MGKGRTHLWRYHATLTRFYPPMVQAKELLDRPPLVMYGDGVITAFSNLDAEWGASFVAGVHDFVDAIVEGRQSSLTGEEGKMVLQFCRAAQRSAKEGREVRPKEIM